MVFGFLGPNGAGKTTAIRLLLNLIEPTGGRADVLGFGTRTAGTPQSVLLLHLSNELHGFSQRDHVLDAWRKELEFLQKYIQPKFGQSSTSTDPLLLSGPSRTTAAAPPRP